MNPDEQNTDMPEFEVPGTEEETPEPEAPKEPALPDVTSIGHDDFLREAQRRGLYQPAPEPAQAPSKDPRLSQVAKHLENYEYEEAAALQQEMAMDAMRREQAQIYAPTATKEVLEEIGIPAEARGYVAEKLKGWTPQMLRTITTEEGAAFRDVLTRAARDYVSEKTPQKKGPSFEPAASEMSGRLGPQEVQTVAEFEKAFGYKPSAETLAMARQYASQEVA